MSQTQHRNTLGIVVFQEVDPSQFCGGSTFFDSDISYLLIQDTRKNNFH